MTHETTEQITQCHECAEKMTHDVRPQMLTYKGYSEIVEMPGWYCNSCSESVHSGPDMEVSDRVIRRLNALAEQIKIGI